MFARTTSLQGLFIFLKTKRIYLSKPARLICSWPPPWDSTPFVPLWHFLPRSVPRSQWLSSFPHKSKREYCQDRCVLLASRLLLQCFILILHLTPTRLLLYLLPVGMPTVVQDGSLSVMTPGKLFWEHSCFCPTALQGWTKKAQRPSKTG